MPNNQSPRMPLIKVKVKVRSNKTPNSSWPVIIKRDTDRTIKSSYLIILRCSEEWFCFPKPYMMLAGFCCLLLLLDLLYNNNTEFGLWVVLPIMWSLPTRGFVELGICQKEIFFLWFERYWPKHCWVMNIRSMSDGPFNQIKEELAYSTRGW